MRPPINSEKHIVQSSLFSVAGSSAVERELIIAVAAPSTVSEVRQGAVVKAVYLEYWILGSGQQPASFTITVEKINAGIASMSFAESQILNEYRNKKNVLYTTQGLVGDANTNPVPILRSWLKIPKGKQRFGFDDGLRITFAAILPAPDDFEVCGVCIYKEYF